MNNEKIGRREFVATTAASVIVTAASASRVRGANNRLRVGVIGCGGLAQDAHLPSLMKMKDADNVEIVAVCDVYQKRLDQATATTGAKPFKDYRALLDQKDIDYVAIVTPEHWHAKMTLDAADAHKHIYCEKPMCWSVDEAKKVVAKQVVAKQVVAKQVLAKQVVAKQVVAKQAASKSLAAGKRAVQQALAKQTR